MRAQCEVRVQGELEPPEFPEPSTPKELAGMRIEAIMPYTQKFESLNLVSPISNKTFGLKRGGMTIVDFIVLFVTQAFN